MPRLADYFVVVGYDYETGHLSENFYPMIDIYSADSLVNLFHTSSIIHSMSLLAVFVRKRSVSLFNELCRSTRGNGQKGGGKILQRFPQTDWPDCPFTQGIEMFCQPTGWSLSAHKSEPTFFVSALTDIEADRHYCACMTFSEDVVAMEPPGREDLDEEDMEQDIPPQFTRTASKMYAPKSLVIVSRLDYFETFRIAVQLIGRLLPGGPQIRFSIGADDRQALQPPISSSLPVTRASVALLLQQLGIANTLTVFCAALSDHKVLFHSQSYTRLTECCHALTSLMFPLKYSYVYIPLLPVGLIEVLSTPTPFIAGVHTSLKPEISELLDVVVGDLDGGSVRLPENIQLAILPEPILSRTLHSLQLILQPELVLSDRAFPPALPKRTSSDMLDKEIRAIFLRMFGELFFGYRSCLTIIRIHPETVITFHKANFLGHRGMIEDEFVLRVLDSMSFSRFVGERGPPYRVCDVFDEVFSSIQDTLKNEESDPDRLLINIRELAQQLYQNENPTSQPYSQKIPRPTDGAHLRVHQPIFPHISAQRVDEIVEEGIAKLSIKNKLSPVWQHFPRIVPIGPHITSAVDQRAQIMSTNARRLEVLRNCVSSIFEGRISDARKIFPAVLRMLKSKTARLSLVEELSYHVKSNRAVLDHQQFDLVVRLLNSALQNESVMDEYGVAAAILPLATAFCRKLFAGVIQFAYTLLQEHAVWGSLQFWEQTFYQDVQLQIRQLYLPQHEASVYPSSPKEDSEVTNGSGGKDLSVRSSDSKRLSTTSQRSQGISALEIAAEQLRIWPKQSNESQAEMISGEESTVYSQAIHYANRIVYMRVPLDASKRIRDVNTTAEGESLSSMVTNSVAESDSYDAESGFEDQEVSEVGSSVTKFVTRFVDKVCAESNVNSDHIKTLHLMIPGVIAMHIETLEAVHQESRRLAPIQKPKILTPALLPGEELVMEGLRVYLIPDGREEATGGPIGGPILLPAEGAIFLTTYRVIFKGTPCDPFACEQIVCRSFPISSLTKEKKLSAQCLTHINQWLQEAIQLRSCTFQLMKMAFDDEVNLEDVETFRKLLLKIRNPPSVISTFAFIGDHIFAQSHQHHKVKEKNSSLKGFAKKTLLKTARKAGLKPMKDTKSQQKYVMPTPPLGRRSVSSIDPLGSLRHDAAPMFGDDLSVLTVIDEQEIQHLIQNDAKNIDRLAERSYCRDYARLNLGRLTYSQSRAQSTGFRLSMINSSYGICQSYPAVLVVPQSVSDDSIQKFARSHRQNRFPVVTWRHPTTKAVLLRGSGFHGKGVMGMLKGHYNNPTGVPGVEGATSVTLEQEKYFSAIVSTTPSGASKKDQAFQRVLGSFRLPTHRESMISEPIHDVTDFSLGRMTLSRRPMSAMASSLAHHAESQSTLKQNGGLADLTSDSHSLHKAALYILGEKTQIKGIRSESFKKCEFVPVDYGEVRHVKSSFKKLMRACLPSSPVPDNDQKKKGFMRAVEESDWLTQLQSILQISGAAVDLLDAQGSSVMICLEDGWDIGTQVASLAQLLLDPYYRTFEGFRVLVEKEWLSFGHRFTHRSNQTADTQASGFAPIFLQFLDVVHQIHSQFPLSFEFNQYYLKFLAYHHVSNRFRTFMMDNEQQRLESGWLLDESKLNITFAMSAAAAADNDSSTAGPRIAAGMCVWDYIDKQLKTSTVFYNFLYSPHNTEKVLRPYSNISSLKLWEYYVQEDLAHGPSYDLEVAVKDTGGGEGDQEGVGEGTTTGGGREIVNSCYDNISQVQLDSFSYMLQELERLEQEMYGASPSSTLTAGHSLRPGSAIRSWKQTWDAIENQYSDQLTRNASFTSTQISRQHGYTVHKRSTLELLVKGRMLGGESSRSLTQSHRFERFNYTTPAYCDYCSNVLWGFVKTGMHCADCGYNCHDKCAAQVPKNCSKMRPLSELSISSTTVSGGNVSDATSTITAGDVGGVKDGEAFLQFSSSPVEHRTHEGYLWKRGALLKGWKQRWFVLDTMKHQIRYYESHEDNSSKDCIELTDVTSVQPIKNVQGAPKKCDENAFFELRTSKRTYQFLAADHKAAQDWIDKLQLAIQ